MSLFVVIISTHHINTHTHHSTLGREFSKQLRHVVGEGLELQPVIITSTNEGKMDRERTKKQEMERKEEEEEEEEERGDERETAFMENTRVKFKNEIDVIKVCNYYFVKIYLSTSILR